MKKVLLVVAVLMVAVMLTVVFVGCSAEDYKKQLEKDGYKTTVLTDETDAGEFAIAAIVAGLSLGFDIDGDMEYVVSGVKDGSSVTIIKFEESSDAKELRKQIKNSDSDAKVGGTGKVVKITINK